MRQARIVSDNAADRALLAVPGTAAGLGVAHLKTDLKGQVCRVLGDVATITMPGGGTLQARGQATVGQRVFVRDGVIEGEAPTLTYVEGEA